ncbi:MAG: LysR substrate-binding domain-containing protein [Hyphomicrobiaceae bacterium]
MAPYPSMRSLRAFEATARHLSVQNAAAELNVTPGAVSRQIQQLEQQFGAELFKRGHRQLTLTREGIDFLSDIRAPLEQIGNAVEAMLRTTGRPTVSLCAYPTFALRWFIPRWSRFYDRHPDIDVRLTTSLAPVDFEREDYDLAIQMIGRKPASGLKAHPIARVETTPVCAPQLASRLHHPSDLRSMILLHSEPRPRDWERWLAFVGVSGVDHNHGLRFESLNLAFQAAIEGLGVAMAIGSLVEDDIASGKLVAPFPQLRRPGKSMQLVYPESRARYESVRIFRDWLLAEAQSVGPSSETAPNKSTGATE